MIEEREFEIFPRHMGFFPYMWLVYLTLPIATLLQQSGWELYVGGGMMLLFIVAYRQLYFVSKTFVMWACIQIATTFFYAFFYEPHHIFMGFFTAYAIGFAPTKKSFRLLVSLLVTMLVLVFLLRGDDISFLNVAPMLVLMLVSPFGMRNFYEKKELQVQLMEANKHIETLVKREERERIARDLHDTLGHTLSLITLKGELVEKLTVKNPERARMEAKEISQTARTALKQLRELISDMRMITIEEEIEHAQNILRAADILLHVEQYAKVDALSKLEQNIVGMCLREVVTNVVKHSKAKECQIHLCEKEGYIVLRVKDNGIGMKTSGDGNGILGMKERLVLIDGMLAIESVQEGTTVTIQIPVVIRARKVEETV
ncbi:histidine kinase [Bacillus manliponensis]|uniref:histidine kinase n=1 Tax=Bacillus manliponensis TaxID=574376 RepID=A0A073K4M2_9BACI|nr:sensor histidine kinase [Bacillus manliponensis]KEK21486.1 histidine kinase [Bacillus manliponensis]